MTAVSEKVNGEQVLQDFLHRVREDARIGPSHISVFIALVYFSLDQQHASVSFYGRELMRVAKISSRTYHQCMQELHRYGYIQYIPSYNPALGSVVWFK